MTATPPPGRRDRIRILGNEGRDYTDRAGDVKRRKRQAVSQFEN